MSSQRNNTGQQFGGNNYGQNNYLEMWQPANGFYDEYNGNTLQASENM